jgi:flagellar hook-associated protein 3 FlgL
MTMRVTHLMLSRGILDDVGQASRRLALTQQKLSSGKELTKPSDDPQAVARALGLRAEMEASAQFQRNVAEAEGWQNVTESSLSSITDALQRVRELVVRAGSDSAGPQARAGIAEEVRGLLDTMKQAANATYGGRFVFSGTATDVRPYAVGGTDDAYAPANTERIGRQIGPGVSVAINVHGAEVLGDGTTGLIASVRDILGHLAGGTPADAAALRGADLAALDGHLDRLNAVRASVGATTNRLEVARGRLMEYEGQTMRLLSETEDADLAKTMIDFSVQQAALQASLKAGANIVQNSLLDFLR